VPVGSTGSNGNKSATHVPYDFKVADGEGTPPAAWGDPKITPNQLTVWGDADGSITVTVDTSVINNIGEFATWIIFDNGPLQVVGDFMNEAGGAGDWDAYDDAFNILKLRMWTSAQVPQHPRPLLHGLRRLPPRLEFSVHQAAVLVEQVAVRIASMI